MATVHAEYLDYKERTTQQLSEKKQRISELKDQLANLDVKQYNEAPKTVHDLAKDAVGHIFNTPSKSKINQRILQESRNDIGSNEKSNRETFEPDIPIQMTNELDYVEREEIEIDQENQNFMSQQDNRPEQNQDSSVQKFEIHEEVDDPHTNALYKNMKEKNDVFHNLKTRILNELGNLSTKQSEFEELEKHFRNKAVDVGQTEQLLKEEIKEVKERLEILSVIKIREK